jgi:hypothetical protein
VACCYAGTNSDSNGTPAIEFTDSAAAYKAEETVLHHSVTTYWAQLDALCTSEHQQSSDSSTPAQKGFRLLAAAEELLRDDTEPADGSSSAHTERLECARRRQVVDAQSRAERGRHYCLE